MNFLSVISKPKFILTGFFLAYFLLGIGVYKDYGISWDEPIQRNTGEIIYNFVTGIDEKLLTHNDKYYGPIFELSLTTLEKATNLADIRDVYFQRHLVNFLIYFVGVFFFYLLCKKRFKSRQIGLLASLMLIISPRLFAHSFYNSKDIPLLVMFIASAYTFELFIDRKSYKSLLIHSIASALTMTTRIVGLAIPLLTISQLLLDLISSRKVLDTGKKAVIYIFLTFTLTTLFWPALWDAPTENFKEAFEEMKRYDQSTSILYFGEKVKSTLVPWHYTIGWILVTTPIMYLVGFLLGLRGSRDFENLDYYAFGWFFVPLAAVIYFKSNLYDAWRQMFFIYPAFLYVSILGITNTKPSLKKIFIALLLINILLVSVSMIRNHPYQNLYFNELAGNKSTIYQRFELDYWGLSYRKAIEYVAEIDKRENIRIRVKGLPGETNVIMLDPMDRKRISTSENIDNPHYYITNYRGEEERDQNNLIYTIFVEKNPIIGVYKYK